MHTSDKISILYFHVNDVVPQHDIHHNLKKNSKHEPNISHTTS